MSDDFTGEQVVGSFRKNAAQQIVGRLLLVRNVPCVDLRMYAPNPEGGMVPTRAGLCLRRSKLPELRRLVDELIAACSPGTFTDEGDEGGA